MQNGEKPAYWNRDAAALAAELGSGFAGLPAARAASLLETIGPNRVQSVSRLSATRLFLRQFASPLVLILVFAAAVSLVLHEPVNASIILAIVIGSSLLSFTQEYRASTAVEALKRRLALTARVLRDGDVQTVPVDAIVPGDVFLLSAGNLVPADGLVIEAQDFLVAEASMTGESFPVEKRPGIVPADAPISARTNSVFLGASVRSGTARVLAVRTGTQTEFGVIAERLKSSPPETEFARGVRQFGYLLIRVMIAIVLFVVTVNLLLDRPAVDSLLFAVALAVGLSPELLPAIISVTLSAGARAMARRGVIVRHLSAIENLGEMDVLCTDKTGTLTEGTTTLNAAIDTNGQVSHDVLRLAFVNASLETGIENPLDDAIVAAGKSANLDIDGVTKVDEIPYDFMRRRLTIVVADAAQPSRHLVITKGAVANILEICTAIDRDGTTVVLDAAMRAALQATFESRSADGYRVLALATRELPPAPPYGRDHERDMSFRGFLVFSDPPRTDASRTIADLARLGISIKIVSGDNRHVTAHLAKAIGLDPTAMLTGEQLAGMRDEALWNVAPRTVLFVEIDPQQKERIVRALQHAGRAVGYLGDGINDAPALHAADVGISVESAVDVARESADIVLLKPDLDVLKQGVEDGRRTFANTLKYIAITTSANFGNMVSMALATTFLPFLPLAAKQILLNNFLSDFPSMAISTDNVDSDSVARPQRWNHRRILRFMILFGLVSSVFDLLTFGLLLEVFHAGESLFQTSWFVISLLTELAVLLVLRTSGSAFRSRPSRMLFWSTVAVAAAAFTLPYLDGISAALGFVPLSAPELGAVVAIVVGYVVATEIAKNRFRHFIAAEPTGRK